MNVFWKDRPQWSGGTKPRMIAFAQDSCFVVDGVEHWVPAGYEIDGASIPAPLWYVAGTPFSPDNVEPAGAHDPLYLLHIYSRSKTDEIMYQLKLAYELRIGTSRKLARFRAWRMWAGVRMGGLFAWRNSIEDKEEIAKIQTIISARPDCEKFKSLWFTVPVV